MSDSECRKMTVTIQVRATPAEKTLLKARAAAFGISVGELVRETIFRTTPHSKTDQDAICELAATRADLGRLGGLLKGWLSGAFLQSTPTHKTHSDVIVLLLEIDEAQKMVVEAFKKVAGKP